MKSLWFPLSQEDSVLRLQHGNIDVAELVQSVASESSGGIDIFLGTTRNQSDGRHVVTLDYEAYEEMALAEIEKIVAHAASRWPLQKISVVHRLGEVPVGEVSVGIAVSAPHRGEAFDACRFIIDELKQTVPIWKKEKFADGTEEWSGSPSRSPKTIRV